MGRRKKKRNDSWTEEDYKNFVLSMIRENASIDTYRRVRIAESFDYYYGKYQPEGYDNLLTLHESPTRTEGKTPFVPINYDSISPKVNSLLGDLSSMGFEVSIRAINREAIERKNIFERQLRYMSEMQPVFQRASQYTGLNAGVNNNIPTSPKAIHAYMKGYTDTYERLMTASINTDIDRQSYRHRRENFFLDLLCSGEVHGKVEIVDGYEKIRRVNPLNAIPDTSTEDDLLADQSRFLEAHYVSIPYAIKHFDIEEKEMEELLENYKKHGAWNGVTAQYNGSAYTIFAPFQRKSGGWKHYNYDRILILEAEWLDVELRSQKYTHKGDRVFLDEYVDNPYNAKLKGNEKRDGNYEDHKKIEVVRRAVLMGGEKLVDYGKTGTYLRNKMNPCKTRLNYVSLLHSYNNQDSISMVDRLGRIQDFKNYALTLLQKHVTSHIGDFVAVDASKIDNRIYGKPGKEAYNNLLLELKAYKVLVYDSKKGGFNQDPNAIPFKQINSQSQGILSDLINIVMMLDAEMKSISGINEARMGQFGERTLKSTAQLGQQASFSMTATYFNAFMAWEKNLFSVYAQAKAMVWANEPEKYEEVALNAGIPIPEDFDIDGQTYESIVHTAPLSQAELKEAAYMALNGGHLTVPDFLDVMEVAKENRREAYEQLKKRIRDREEMMIQRQEQIQLATMQADQQGKQLDYRKEIDKENTRGKWNFDIARIKSDAQVDAGVIKSATDEEIEKNKYEVEKEKTQIQRFQAMKDSERKKMEDKKS